MINNNNLNKPTSPFWSKIILVCTTISGAIASYGMWADMKEVIVIGGVFGVLGSVLPVLLSDGSDRTKAISAIIILMLFSACSAQKQLQRAEALIHKAEAKGAKWHTDTIVKNVQVIVPLVTTDTIVKPTYDTITVFKDRVLTKVKISPNEVYIKSTCLPDTVTVEKEVIINKTIEAPPCIQKIKWWELLLSVVAALIIVAVLGRLVFR